MIELATRRLEGRTALVIGGGTGFGRATAELFAAHGAHVVIAGRRLDVATEAANSIGGSAVECDITDEAQVETMVNRAGSERGRLDVSVNYAGFERSTPLKDLTSEILRPMVEAHLIGAISVMRHVALAMTTFGHGGSIISISSLTAHNPGAGLIAYGASKRALEYATEIAAVELGPAGIRVNCIAPHLIETPMTAGHFQKPLAIEAIRMQTPLGRMGDVSDVAKCALYLASDDSSYVSGQTILVDGGASTQKLPSRTDYELLAAARPDLLK